MKSDRFGKQRNQKGIESGIYVGRIILESNKKISVFFVHIVSLFAGLDIEVQLQAIEDVGQMHSRTEPKHLASWTQRIDLSAENQIDNPYKTGKTC